MTAASATPPLPEARSLFPEIHERSAADGNILWAALAGACLLHLAAFTLPMPEPEASPPPVKDPDGPQVTRTVLPPPTPEPRPPVERQSTRRLPMLEDPDMPAVEPLPESTPEALSDDFAEAVMLAPGPVVAPPAVPGDEIHDQWEPGLTLPVAHAGRARPVYPPLGARVRKEGRVLLAAIITERGDVVSIEVLSAPDPDLGFVAAAIDAVSQWKYEPGVLNGRPVAVSLTVRVDFSLR